MKKSLVYKAWNGQNWAERLTLTIKDMAIARATLGFESTGSAVVDIIIFYLFKCPHSMSNPF